MFSGVSYAASEMSKLHLRWQNVCFALENLYIAMVICATDHTYDVCVLSSIVETVIEWYIQLG